MGQNLWQAVFVDPQPLWLEAVEVLLRRMKIEVAGRATAIDEALALVEEHEPDLLVTELEDFADPVDPIAYVREAKRRVPELRIIVLSSNHDYGRIQLALDAGASAYVVKTALPEDIAAAIRQAFDHSVFFAMSGLENANGRIQPEPQEVEKLRSLTRRELEILELVADGSSNAQLARRLWVSEQTVKFHLSNIYRKLGLSNRTEATHWAHLYLLSNSDSRTLARVSAV